ncbi:MAG: hypothetical protein BWX45_00853 [Deltaproteobacteria bacterium ADurb.Bin002]|nr:MAG: hypothetical protein BWX45_00853 [Deltaproteobacteria bacterium ADurb.Bin002]
MQHHVAGDAGIVDDNVERAEFGHGRIDHFLDHRPVGNAAQNGESLPAFGPDLFHHGLGIRFVDVIYDNFRAFFGKAHHNAFSDAASRSRHNGYFVFQSHTISFSIFFRGSTVYRLFSVASHHDPLSRPAACGEFPGKGPDSPPRHGFWERIQKWTGRNWALPPQRCFRG